MNLQVANENKSALDRYPLCKLPLPISLRSACSDLDKHIRSECNRTGEMIGLGQTMADKQYNGFYWSEINKM